MLQKNNIDKDLFGKVVTLGSKSVNLKNGLLDYFVGRETTVGQGG